MAARCWSWVWCPGRGSPLPGRIPPRAITGTACPCALWPGIGVPLLRSGPRGHQDPQFHSWSIAGGCARAEGGWARAHLATRAAAFGWECSLLLALSFFISLFSPSPSPPTVLNNSSSTPVLSPRMSIRCCATHPSPRSAAR